MCAYYVIQEIRAVAVFEIENWVLRTLPGWQALSVAMWVYFALSAESNASQNCSVYVIADLNSPETT